MSDKKHQFYWCFFVALDNICRFAMMYVDNIKEVFLNDDENAPPKVPRRLNSYEVSTP